MRDAGKGNQKTIPKSGRPGSDVVQKTREPREEHDADRGFPLFASLNPAFRESRAEDVPEESHAGAPGIPDLDRVRIVDSFLGELGREIHKACRQDMRESMQEPMPVERIVDLCRNIYTNLSKEVKKLILPLLKTSIIPALRCIPCYLLAEKDPDHPGENEIPDIKELLALDVYLRKYEQINLKRKSIVSFSGYHRGAAGQPDFVYQNEKRETLKSFDPLRLPREGSEETWLEGAYEHHAGGKNTGAVCILDVSDAADEKLLFWTEMFKNILDAIIGAIDNALKIGDDDEKFSQHDKLMHLCNTYVVSYGENADGKPVEALQGVFESARMELQARPALQQLEDWRKEHSEPMDLGDIFDKMYGE